MRNALLATAIGTGIVVASSAPAWAQMRTSQPQRERPSASVTTFSTPKPSGAFGVFGWFPMTTAGPLTPTGWLPGIAGNLWFTPNFSVGVRGFTGAFTGYGPITSADLEGKVKFFQSGTGVWGTALTGSAGAKYLSYAPGTGVGVSVGLIGDMYLPNRFVLQGRVGYTPWMAIAGANRQVLDGKLGLGYPLTDSFGVDAGIRTESVVAGPDPFQITGPYLGMGLVF